jgi:hypothetical protein
VNILSAVTNKLITQIHTDTISRLSSRLAANQIDNADHAQEILNYLLLGPSAAHPIFYEDSNGRPLPNPRCPKELYECHRNVARAFRQAWRKNSGVLHRFYEKKKIQHAQAQNVLLQQTSEEDDEADDSD